MDTPEKWPYEWMGVIAALITFLGWVKRQEGFEMLTLLVRNLRPSEKTFKLKQLRAMRNLSHQLSRTLRDSHGVRANAICLHNGGGDITAKGPRYLTVYDSQSGDVLIDSSEAWQKAPLSADYDREIMRPLLKLQGTPLVITTKALADSNPLKAHYEADGITHAVVCLGRVARDVVWFVSLNYRSLPAEPDPDDESPEACDATTGRAIATSVARHLARHLAELSEDLPTPKELLS